MKTLLLSALIFAQSLFGATLHEKLHYLLPLEEPTTAWVLNEAGTAIVTWNSVEPQPDSTALTAAGVAIDERSRITAIHSEAARRIQVIFSDCSEAECLARSDYLKEKRVSGATLSGPEITEATALRKRFRDTKRLRDAADTAIATPGTQVGDISWPSLADAETSVASSVTGGSGLSPTGDGSGLTGITPAQVGADVAGAAAAAQAAAVQRANHTGTQTLATISDAGTAASHAHTEYATAAQGALAATAVQPGALASYVPTTRTVNGQALSGDVSITTITGNAGTVTTNANLTGPVTSTGNATAIANGAITNAMLANAAVANLSGTNSGDNAANTAYANDYRAANFVAGTNYLAPNGSAAALTGFPTFNQSTTGSAATLTTARNINGVAFNGSANITVTAAAETLTGAALPALGGASLTGLTKTQVGLSNVDNTADSAKPISTAQATAINAATSVYRPILSVAGSHIAARVAGTYAIPHGDALAISGTGTLYPIGLIHIAAADYPTVNGLAAKLRIRAQLMVNDVAPTGNFTFGLYPVTRPATSGGAGLNIYTLGTVVSGSNGATFTAPAADSAGTAVGSDFALPADGLYCIGVVTTATVATSSHVHISAQLQAHNL